MAKDNFSLLDFGNLDCTAIDDLLNGGFLNQCEEPFIEILEQPKSRGYRFRYKSEGGTHGPIQGEGWTKQDKKYPAIRIVNYKGPARVLVALVTHDDPPCIHAHNLTGEKAENGYAVFEVSEETNMTLWFTKLSIEHVTKQSIVSTLVDKLQHEDHLKRLGQHTNEMVDFQELIDSLPESSGLNDNQLRQSPLSGGKECYIQKAEELKERINLGALRLRITAYLKDIHGKYTKEVPPVYTHIIHDAKSSGELKIVKLSKTSGSVNGYEDLILLCEKVTKGNVQIRFFTESGVPWHDFASFSQADVHKQYAISFRTPPYRDRSISKPVTVQVELCRKDDAADRSRPVEFTYEPQKHDNYKIGEKRKKEPPAEIDDFLRQEFAKKSLMEQPSTSTQNFDLSSHEFPILDPSWINSSGDIDINDCGTQSQLNRFLSGLFVPKKP